MGRFRDALAGPRLAGIAEIKRRSPSAGDLRPNADPAGLAADFERAGAAAVSVLVDERFAGSTADLVAARAAADAPLLAKGFFSSEEQLVEMKEAGADAVLLLLRDLDDPRAAGLMAEAGRLGLDTLVEAHDAAELERALELDAEVIGINNRNLDEGTVDISTTYELMPDVPAGKTVVAESGISGREELEELDRVGVDAVLIGGALMSAPDPEAKTRELTGADEGTREHLF